MTDNPKVWLALDPESGMVRLLLNGQAIGRVVTEKGQHRIKVDPEHQAQFAAVEPYAAGLFSGMGETLAAAQFEVGAFRVNKVGRPQAARIPQERRTQIHLGCGPDLREGWLNVDYQSGAPLGYDPMKNFLNFDLRGGLPLPDASAELIFSSHFFEHLQHHHATHLMRECRRVLKPGGVARFQMPDYRRAFDSYVRRDPAVLEHAVGADGMLDHMPGYARHWGDLITRAIFEYYEHKYIWDPENLGIALRQAGFSEAYEDKPIEGLDNLSDARKDASFYLQAIA